MSATTDELMGYKVATIRVQLQRSPDDQEPIDTLRELHRLQLILKHHFTNWHLVDAAVHVEALL